MQSQDDGVLQPLATVSARQGLEPLALRLTELRLWLQDDLNALEQALAEVPSDALPGPRVQGAVEHLMRRTGKRIRPLCVLLSARLGQRVLDPTLCDLAVACELVHAATLLHDDVIDDAKERRGAPAARILYGNSASILAGDHLLVHALQRVHGTGYPDLLASLLGVISKMVAAEALQLERRGRFEPSEEIYLEVIRGKTAALFGWGLRAGGTVADLDAQALATLEQVGTHLGMAFQLVDDVLDLEGDPTITGKDALVDIREGKLTWPVIVAAERDAGLCAELAAIAAEHGQELEPSRAKALVAGIRATGALQVTRAYARAKAAEACALLDGLPAGKSRSALRLVVESTVHRIQ